MNEHSESAMSAINGAATTKINTAATTTTAGGLVIAGEKPDVLGTALMHNGVLGLSWIEVFQVIGALYVTAQLIKLIIPLILNLKETIMPAKGDKPKKPTSTQSTSTVKVKKPKSTKAPA